MAASGTGGALADYDWWVKAVGKLAEANVPGPYPVDLSPSRGDRARVVEGVHVGLVSNVGLPRPVGMPDPFVTSQLPLSASPFKSYDHRVQPEPGDLRPAA